MPIERAIVEPPPQDRNPQRNQQRDESPVGHIVIFGTHYFLFWTNHLKTFGEGSSGNERSNETGTRLYLGSKIAEIAQMARGRIASFRPQRSIAVTTLPLGEI
jgi:hypothetical protein